MAERKASTYLRMENNVMKITHYMKIMLHDSETGGLLL